MKKPGWLDEFKTFISRGNVIDLAVGVVVGGAFTAIVTALVNDIINPLISLIIGGLDFSGVTVGVFPIGDLIMAIINFLCISFVVFWMVKIINRFKGQNGTVICKELKGITDGVVKRECVDCVRDAAAFLEAELPESYVTPGTVVD